MFHKLKCKIEERRCNPRHAFWKLLVQAKDFLWKIQLEFERVFIVFSDVFKAESKSKMKYAYRRFKHWDLPMWEGLRIELHSFCNRDCVWCPRHKDRSGIRKDSNGNSVKKIMPIEKVYDLIDQASRLGYKGGIGFHRLSEGLLDKRFLAAWKYAKSKGMKLDDDTNGDVLKKNPKLCFELDEPGNRLTIGLYDCDTDVKRIQEINFWKNRFRKAEIRFSEPLRKNLQLRQNTPLYELAERSSSELDRPCLPGDLLIRYDGKVSLCCEDDQCFFNLGDVFEQNIDEIWWSERHARILKALRQPGGRHQFDLCKNCYGFTKVINDKERLSFIAEWIEKNTPGLR